MDKNEKVVELEDGGGGKKSEELIGRIRKILNFKGAWSNTNDDSAIASVRAGKIAFTTDGFIVDPIFFPGGDIGKIAITGTINDLLVMGADPLGIALSMVIEEGFPLDDLEKIVRSMNEISTQTKVPIVTGDTKTTERGKIDKIEMTTSGVGVVKKLISNGGARPGDVVIVSGDLGEHGAALLSKRFNYKTKIKSDCHAFLAEMKAVREFLTSAKDPTRGGLAAILNEISEKSKTKIVLEEDNLPYKKDVRAISDLLGIDVFSFPSEGRFVATVSEKNAKKVIGKLQRFNKEAKIIGRVEKGRGVWLKTRIGSQKRIETPRGKLIPRIC
jgi:hydrogenase expression/formation protein HypE